jgi:hypothetical protein
MAQTTCVPLLTFVGDALGEGNVISGRLKLGLKKSLCLGGGKILNSSRGQTGEKACEQSD